MLGIVDVLKLQGNTISIFFIYLPPKNNLNNFFSIKFDLKSRHTLWSLFIGGFVYWLKTNAVSQNMIQRYLSLPTLQSARRYFFLSNKKKEIIIINLQFNKNIVFRALWIFIIGVIILLGLCCFSGLLIYAKYYDCDPLTTKVK